MSQEIGVSNLPFLSEWEKQFNKVSIEKIDLVRVRGIRQNLAYSYQQFWFHAGQQCTIMYCHSYISRASMIHQSLIEMTTKYLNINDGHGRIHKIWHCAKLTEQSKASGVFLSAIFSFFSVIVHTAFVGWNHTYLGWTTFKIRAKKWQHTCLANLSNIFFCMPCLIHFSWSKRIIGLRSNIRKSSIYLICTTFKIRAKKWQHTCLTNLSNILFFSCTSYFILLDLLFLNRNNNGIEIEHL